MWLGIKLGRRGLRSGYQVTERCGGDNSTGPVNLTLAGEAAGIQILFVCVVIIFD